MSAQILVLYHHPADTAAFDRYYLETHLPIAQRIPGVRSITISRPPVTAGERKPLYYQVAVLDFDSLEALEAGMATPEGAASGTDLANFATEGFVVLTYQAQVM